MAGLIKAKNEGMIEQQSRVVIIYTENGLKDIKSAQMAVCKRGITIRPAMNELQEALGL